MHEGETPPPSPEGEALLEAERQKIAEHIEAVAPGIIEDFEATQATGDAFLRALMERAEAKPAAEEPPAEPAGPRIEVEVQEVEPDLAPLYRCPRKQHLQRGAFRHIVPPVPDIGQPEIISGPVCRACLFDWIGRKFSTKLDKKATARQQVGLANLQAVPPEAEPANDTEPAVDVAHPDVAPVIEAARQIIAERPPAALHCRHCADGPACVFPHEGPCEECRKPTAATPEPEAEPQPA